jgi:hypothetical protein
VADRAVGVASVVARARIRGHRERVVTASTGETARLYARYRRDLPADQARELAARLGGGIAVVTQGPPLWLGPAPWQQGLRRALEQFFGPTTDTCGSDAAALEARRGIVAGLGLEVDVASWRTEHTVDTDWVVGHLGSSLPADALRPGEPGGPADALRQVLDDGQILVEEATTTAVIGRLRLR